MNQKKRIITVYWVKKLGLYVIAKYLYLFIRYVLTPSKENSISEEWSIEYEIQDKKFHIWGGYYDKSPLNADNSKIAYLKTPVKGGRRNKAIVEIYDLEQSKVIYTDTTEAWNWQQGCMLQWIGDKKDTIIYNIYDSSTKNYKAKSVNLNNKEFKCWDLAIYAMHPQQTKFLSLNFARLDKLIYDYGYCALDKVSLSDKTDGVWEVDMLSNKSSILFSISDVTNFMPKSEFQTSEHYVNHIDYSPDGKSVIMIHRWTILGQYKSRLLSYNLKDKKFMLLLDYNMVSHFCWFNESTLLIFAMNKQKKMGYFKVNINTGICGEIYSTMPAVDGHPSFSCSQEILTDTYPDKKRIQHLYIGSLEAPHEIYSFYSPFKYFDGNRCDLHPKWSYDGQRICVDTTYRGYRSLCVLRKK